MRIVDEFLHPENKCKRIGHDLRKTKSRWVVSCDKYNEFVKPKGGLHYSCVAHYVEKIEMRCQRCNHVVSTEWADLYSLQMIKFPAMVMDEFQREGKIRVIS